MFISELKYYLPGDYCVDVVLNDDAEDYEYEEANHKRKEDKVRRRRKEDFSLLILYCYADGRDTQECVSQDDDDCVDR